MELDLFTLFRGILFLFLMIYAALMAGTAIWHAVEHLRGTDRVQETMRVYVTYQLLTVRFEPLRGEFLQIGGWLVMLALVWWLHGLI